MPRPDWQPLVRGGTVGVRARVLLNRNGIAVANLKFTAGATIDEHSAPVEIDVLCLAGQGFVSIEGQSSPLRAGERVVWPAGVRHRVWTQDFEMETVMIERR